MSRSSTSITPRQTHRFMSTPTKSSQLESEVIGEPLHGRCFTILVQDVLPNVLFTLPCVANIRCRLNVRARSKCLVQSLLQEEGYLGELLLAHHEKAYNLTGSARAFQMHCPPYCILDLQGASGLSDALLKETLKPSVLVIQRLEPNVPNACPRYRIIKRSRDRYNNTLLYFVLHVSTHGDDVI